MENLKRVIERYIQTKNTFYALLINGDWGCGKTFFIKANYFKKQQTQLKINGDEQREPQFCYISLNGLTKTDDIMAQFTAELLSARDWKKKFGVGDGDKQTNHFLNRLALGVTKNAKSIFDKALDKVGFKFENIIEFFEHGNCVIFIDDLERCKLPIEETLGYINTHFVEHAGLKIIFLANEREITSHDKNQTYQTIKEKIIGRTIEFEATLEENLISIVGQYSDELQRFVKKYKDVIINVISLAELNKKHNLRTLQFAFEMFEPLLKLMNERSAGVPSVNNDSIHEMIIEYFLYACYVHKAGKKIQDEINKAKNKSQVVATGTAVWKTQSLAAKMADIDDKYVALAKMLYDYIELGYYNEEEFKKQLKATEYNLQNYENLIETKRRFDLLSQFAYPNFSDFENDLKELASSMDESTVYHFIIDYLKFIIEHKTLINEIKLNYADDLIFHIIDVVKQHKSKIEIVGKLNELKKTFNNDLNEIIVAIEDKKTSPSLPVIENWFDTNLEIAWWQSYPKEQIQKFSKLVIESIIHSYKSFDSIKRRIALCINPEIIEQLLYDLEQHSSKVETNELIRYKLQIIIDLLSENQKTLKEND